MVTEICAFKNHKEKGHSVLSFMMLMEKETQTYEKQQSSAKGNFIAINTLQ